MIVVIPTNRSINLDYLAPLIDAGARFVIVDDSEGSVDISHPQFEVFNWGHRRKMLGNLADGFPRKNGACRDFGFYIAWRTSDPGEIIVALDDDCKAHHADFSQRIEHALSDRSRPVATCEGTHLNILDLYDGIPENLFPRGFPYSERVGHRKAWLKGEEHCSAAFCLGLWKGVFDVNGIDKISGPKYSHPDAELNCDSVLIEEGKLVSVCSMNMQFRRELIPAVYQFPMHVEVMPNWKIDRYGDIWGGFVLKILMDLKQDGMVAGEPMITHLKEGNYSRNIWQEHLCHLVNDEFLSMLAEIKETLEPDSYLEMMKATAEGLRIRTDRSSPILKAYLKDLCNALDAWTASLDQVEI